MLIRELREREQANLVTRTVYPQVPPKAEYALSELGETLRPLLHSVSKFGLSYAKKSGQAVQ